MVGVYIVVLFLLRCLIQDPTFVCWLRSEINLPIMRELVPHYLQDSGRERLDYLEDGKIVFRLRLRLCSSLYAINERIRDFFLEYDRHTLRTMKKTSLSKHIMYQWRPGKKKT